MYAPQGQVALVSGASRGIGQEIALQLAERGILVYAGVRRQGAAITPALERAHDVNFLREIELDVTRPESIHAAIGQILQDCGRIDILVNNAGVSDGDHDALKVDDKKFTDVMDVNVLGAWRLSEAVIPTMMHNNYGRIVNVSSTLGSLHHLTRPTEPVYRVSKAALNALTRILAARLADTGILVNSASPGWVRTDLGGPNAPRSVQQGADTPVWLATLPADGPSGGFFYDRAPLEW